MSGKRQLIGLYLGTTLVFVVSACAVCTRLWRKYGEATANHIHVQGRLENARLSHEEEALQALKEEEERALQARANAREAVAAHEAAEHPPAAFTA